MSTIIAQPWSAQMQHERFTILASKIRACLRPHLNDDATGRDLLWWDQERVALWASNAFLVGSQADIDFANVIMTYVREQLRPQIAPNVFTASAVASVLIDHDDKLDPAHRDYLRDLLRQLAPFGHTADFQFHGYNDNMPVMWTWALTYAGEHLGDSQSLTIARANLEQLNDLLRRRGAVSEYGFHYSTHRLTGIARVAEHAQDAGLRQLATDIEARLWAELAGLYHPNLGLIGGAAARGGNPLQFEQQALLTCVFGETFDKPWIPQQIFMDTTEAVLELEHDPQQYAFAYPWGYIAEFAAATYHVPSAVADLFFEKPAGFHFDCTAEAGYFNPGIRCKQRHIRGEGGMIVGIELTDETITYKDAPQYGAQPHLITAWHGENFTLGSSSTHQYASSHALRCTYRHNASPQNLSDLGELQIRYNINNKIPGGRTENTYELEPGESQSKANYCELYWDQGRQACLQHESTVMCLQTPNYQEAWRIKELRSDIFLAHKGQWPGRIFVDKEVIGKLPYTSEHESQIDIDLGSVFMSIHPLIGRTLTRPCAIRIANIPSYRNAGFVMISLFNYQGDEIELTPHEIAKLGNGFVLEVRDADDYSGFDDFRSQMTAARSHDQLYGGRRRVHYARDDLRLSMHYCPYTHTVMQASINGREREQTKLAFSNGLEQQLPLMESTDQRAGDDWQWIETQMTRPIETYNPRE